MSDNVDFNHVCEHLPQGWEVEIRLGKEACSIKLHGPDGGIAPIADVPNELSANRINRMIIHSAITEMKGMIWRRKS